MDTLIDKIQEEMNSDTEDREEQSEYLKDYYNESTDEQKKRIDLCFMALCGWELKTLIEKA